MEPSGRNLVATGGECGNYEYREIKPKRLPWVASSCRRSAMEVSVAHSWPKRRFDDWLNHAEPAWLPRE
jgi:hypothetical protein